ncbi:MAG: helix-turn-helix domain-containing protein [Sporichthyaceae bacterium]
MIQLLGRIGELDPQACHALRVVACFDELCVGGVNTRGLLSAAAALSGCVAGFRSERTGRGMRVAPSGELAHGSAGPKTTADASDGLTVWLECTGEPGAHDAIILERLALSVRLRHARGPRDVDGRRHMGLLLDAEVANEERRVAGARLNLTSTSTYRVVAAPLFATWTEHPVAPEDVVPTRHGPMHALVVSQATATLQASPCGIGVATSVERLHHSFRTAMVALLLCEPPAVPVVNADSYAGLVDLLADVPGDSPYPDVELVDKVAQHPWGLATLDVVIRAASSRQAARDAAVHHSTMQARIESIVADLGFDPFDGYGRFRAGIAYLGWRLSRSRVLDLPVLPRADERPA